MPLYVTVGALILMLAFGAFSNFAVLEQVPTSVGVVITVIQLAFFIGVGFCAWKAAQGAGWGRIVLLVFGGLAVVGGLGNLVLVPLVGAAAPLVGVAYLLAGIAILVVWLLPATSRAMRERSGQR